MKQIKFLISNLIRIFIELILSIIPRDKKLIIMGARVPKTIFMKKERDVFLHNTKYLFLYLNSMTSNYNVVYICDDEKIINKFHNLGYKNIYKRNSIKGFIYLLRAKFWICNNDKKIDIANYLSGGATTINLYHGIPAKKIVFDQYKNFHKKPAIIKYLHKNLSVKSDYYIVNSEYEQSCYETAFLTDKKNIKILGSPRLDVLLHDIQNEDLFMEEDFLTIKNFKEQGRKIFIYTPTFRDTGKDISGWLKIDKLKQFLKEHNAVLVCKLHFADKNSLNFELTEEFYKMDSDSDIYPVLKYSDALITDYSSIYFDYLLLDKPILYYPIDLEEYQEKCRGFYRPYEELTAGIKAYSEEELISAMQDVVKGVDDYKEARKTLRNRMFKNQDGKNCERVIEFIKSLN